MTREQLLEHVWHYDFGGNDAVVATHISYLRKKVNALGTPLIRTQRGTGLGLAIVAATVTAHQGTVTIDPPEDGGAGLEVRVKLPLTGT